MHNFASLSDILKFLGKKKGFDFTRRLSSGLVEKQMTRNECTLFCLLSWNPELIKSCNVDGLEVWYNF